jgi:type IX secretion system PorP/SprF family membrane protein
LKRLFYISLLLIISINVNAQQLPLYSQYLYNKFLINPAVAGSDGYTSFSLTAREQWVGYYGAPRTFSFSGQTRILKRSFILKQTKVKKSIYRPKSDGKVGIGGYIFSDKNGLVQRTGFQAAYSYHLWLQNRTQLSLGLAFTGYHFKIDEKELNFEDPNEPLLNSDLRKGIFVPDASFGIYLLDARYSVGFSAEQLFQSVARFGSDAYGKFKISRHYYIFGSYNFARGPYMELQPSFLFRMSEQFKPQADFGLTYIYNQAFWAGLAYRTSGVIIANMGVKYQKLFFGYAFDFTLQEIQRITYGSHEITLAIKFGDNSRRYRWLDRY